MKNYDSPNKDYSINILDNWKPYYQSTDSSNVVFDIDFENSINDTNNIYLLSIVRYNTGIYSDPEKEHERNIYNLTKDKTSIEIIESGKSNLLGFETYYLHTREKAPNKTDNIDLYFQVRNNIDSNYYVLQIRTPENGKEKYNMCLMTEMLKSFKINEYP